MTTAQIRASLAGKQRMPISASESLPFDSEQGRRWVSARKSQPARCCRGINQGTLEQVRALPVSTPQTAAAALVVVGVSIVSPSLDGNSDGNYFGGKEMQAAFESSAPIKAR